jgi:hypothetical protein
VTRRGGVTTLAGGDATPRRENGGDDVSWSAVNLSRSKNKEKSQDQFSYYKWTVKI